MSDNSAEQVLEAVRSEATKYGRCCDFYQDGLGEFHCSDCGQRTFSMLHGVQLILGGTKAVPVMSHEEAREAAAIRAAAFDLLSIAKRWAALDGGRWHRERYAREKEELLADTTAAIAKAEGRS